MHVYVERLLIHDCKFYASGAWDRSLKLPFISSMYTMPHIHYIETLPSLTCRVAVCGQHIVAEALAVRRAYGKVIAV